MADVEIANPDKLTPVQSETQQPEGVEVLDEAQGDQPVVTDNAVIEVKPSPSRDESQREQWGSKIQYFLTLVGYAVGFGNIWRFPYLLHSNGGAAFLIPYVLMLILEGIPLFYLELAIGQRLRKGGVGCWFEIHPSLGGVGLSMGMTCYLVELYYNMLVAYVISYLLDSFRTPLPWTDCTSAIKSGLNSTMKASALKECDASNQASKYYWYRRTLDVSDSIKDPGDFNWYMFLYLTLAWLIVWGILVNGLKCIGKVVYFTSLFPYVILFTFFVANFFYAGWNDGLRILFQPDWNVLLQAKVWLTAATQIFFSLGVGYGCLIEFASHLPSNNNCAKDAVYISIINCSTSLLAAIVIFPILGARGHNRYKACINNNGTGCSLEKEIRQSGSGTGLVFIAFAEASLQLPGPPQIWCFMFFLMLLTLGIDSSFGTCEGAISAIVDMKFVKWAKWKITSICCFTLWLFSIMLAAGWGTYVFALLDEFVANWTLLIIAFFEMIGVAWVYGLARFSYDIKLMTGQKPPLFLLILWRFVSPALIVGILIMTVVGQATQGFSYQKYIRDKGDTSPEDYPTHVIAIGYMLWLSAVLWIPVQAGLSFFGRSLKKEDAPAFFPEDELRLDRHMDPEYDYRDDLSVLDKMVIGPGSLHNFDYNRTSVHSIEVVSANELRDEPETKKSNVSLANNEAQ